jgi:hypothetical protein
MGAASSVISVECSLQKMTDFYDRQDVKDWMAAASG